MMEILPFQSAGQILPHRFSSAGLDGFCPDSQATRHFHFSVASRHGATNDPPPPPRRPEKKGGGGKGGVVKTPPNSIWFQDKVEPPAAELF